MPNSRSLRRVVLVWLLRAWALRGWWSVSHQDRISTATAVCSWHTVNSRFFPPFLPYLGEEQVADRRQHQVAFQAQIAPALVLIQADLALVVLKTALHSPTRKSHQQQGPDS